MGSSRVRVRTVAVGLAVSLVGAVTGCTAEPEPSGPAPGVAASETPSSGAPDPSEAVATGPLLRAEPLTSRALCVEEVAAGDRYGFYGPVVAADADATLTGLRAVTASEEVTVIDAVVAPLTSRPGFGPGAGVGSWPLQVDARVRRKTEWARRQPLDGAQVAAGERMLLLVGLRVAPRTRLDALELDFTAPDGGSAGTVTFEIGTDFRAGRC